MATGWRELRLIFSITVALTLGEMAWVSVWLCLPPALQKRLCSLWLSCGSAICPGFAKPLTRCDIGDMPVVNRCQRPVLPRSPTRCLPRAWWRRWAPAAMWMAWVAETWLRAGAAGLDLGRAALQCGCPGTCGWLLVWLKQSLHITFGQSKKDEYRVFGFCFFKEQCVETASSSSLDQTPWCCSGGRVGLKVQFALYHHLCDPILPRFCPLVGVLSAHTACGTMSHHVCKNAACCLVHSSRRSHVLSLHHPLQLN